MLFHISCIFDAAEITRAPENYLLLSCKSNNQTQGGNENTQNCLHGEVLRNRLLLLRVVILMLRRHSGSDGHLTEPVGVVGPVVRVGEVIAAPVADAGGPGPAHPPRQRHPLLLRDVHIVAAQVEFGSGQSYLAFKSVGPGGFNTGFVGSTCTTLPWRRTASRGTGSPRRRVIETTSRTAMEHDLPSG